MVSEGLEAETEKYRVKVEYKDVKRNESVLSFDEKKLSDVTEKIMGKKANRIKRVVIQKGDGVTVAGFKGFTGELVINNSALIDQGREVYQEALYILHGGEPVQLSGMDRLKEWVRQNGDPRRWVGGLAGGRESFLSGNEERRKRYLNAMREGGNKERAERFMISLVEDAYARQVAQTVRHELEHEKNTEKMVAGAVVGGVIGLGVALAVNQALIAAEFPIRGYEMQAALYSVPIFMVVGGLVGGIVSDERRAVDSESDFLEIMDCVRVDYNSLRQQLKKPFK